MPNTTVLMKVFAQALTIFPVFRYLYLSLQLDIFTLIFFEIFQVLQKINIYYSTDFNQRLSDYQTKALEFGTVYY